MQQLAHAIGEHHYKKTRPTSEKKKTYNNQSEDPDEVKQREGGGGGGGHTAGVREERANEGERKEEVLVVGWHLVIACQRRERDSICSVV